MYCPVLTSFFAIKVITQIHSFFLIKSTLTPVIEENKKKLFVAGIRNCYFFLPWQKKETPAIVCA